MVMENKCVEKITSGTFRGAKHPSVGATAPLSQCNYVPGWCLGPKLLALVGIGA